MISDDLRVRGAKPPWGINNTDIKKIRNDDDESTVSWIYRLGAPKNQGQRMPKAIDTNQATDALFPFFFCEAMFQVFIAF